VLDFPIVRFQMLDNGTGDFVFVLCQRAAHSADKQEPLSAPHQDGSAQFVGFSPTLPENKNICRTKVKGLIGSADSGDCGQVFRLIADSDSDRSRTAFR
jgi:hypothetical protein